MSGYLSSETSDSKGRIYQTTPIPNWFFDHVMAYLTAEECKIFIFACRQILGWERYWQARKRRISVREFMQIGLSRDAIVKATRTLDEYGLLIKDGEASNKGQVFYIPQSLDSVNLTELQERHEQVKRQNKKRTASAQRSLAKHSVTQNDNPAHDSVTQNNTYPAHSPATDETEPARSATQNDEPVQTISDNLDNPENKPISGQLRSATQNAQFKDSHSVPQNDAQSVTQNTTIPQDRTTRSLSHRTVNNKNNKNKQSKKLEKDLNLEKSQSSVVHITPEIASDDTETITYSSAWNWTCQQLTARSPDMKWHLRDSRLFRVEHNTFHIEVSSENSRQLCEGRFHREIKNTLRMAVEFEPKLAFSVMNDSGEPDLQKNRDMALFQLLDSDTCARIG